jgi:UPF0271 protein
MNKKIKVFILDTSAIFSGIPLNLNDSEILTTPEVSDEIKPGGKDYNSFELLLEKGLKKMDYSNDSLKKIKITAEKTGDIKRLSRTDLSILALAFDKYKEKQNPVILTDDYSIQNVASELGMKFKSISQKGIKKTFKWQVRCQGCGKYFKDNLNICHLNVFFIPF